MTWHRFRSFSDQHKDDFWKFTIIGIMLTMAQLKLQKYELSHGYTKHDLLWVSQIQGFVLANIGMAANKYWTFRRRRLPWVTVIIYWQMQRIPHWIASTAIYAFLLVVAQWSYFWATLGTAGSVGLGSFLAATLWSMKDRVPKTEITA